MVEALALVSRALYSTYRSAKIPLLQMKAFLKSEKKEGKSISTEQHNKELNEAMI